MNAHAPFSKQCKQNINKMKLHTGTCLTTNIQRVLQSALVTEIALNTFSNQLSVQEMTFIIDTLVTSLARGQSHTMF